MEGGHKKNNGEGLKKQLAMAVTSIGWSYAIFWSPSTQIRGLEWREGYYNGDVKTRKTTQTTIRMMDEDEIIHGCERSDQLRELYEFLHQNQSHPPPPQRRRPTAALSPEDLTNTEWYYLICMSFVFSHNQELPGTCLANGQPIWLTEANYNTTRIFSRAVLAKGAGIKTLVCFPFMSGVLEIGVTESVQEDLNLIQQLKTSFLDVPSTLNQFTTNTLQTPPQAENLTLASPPTDHNSSNEELTNCIHTSKTLVNFENQQEKPLDFDQHEYDLHYLKVLSTLFNKPPSLIEGTPFHHPRKGSSFTRWRGGEGKEGTFEREGRSKQRVLKAILFDVPKMYLYELVQDEGDMVVGGDDNGVDCYVDDHVLNERRRRRKVNQGFCVLKSLIPPTSKGDKVSILDKTIAYLKELERRVKELESHQELLYHNKRKTQDMEERITCDKYKDNVKYGSKNKRKQQQHDIEDGIQSLSSKDKVVKNMVRVTMVGKDITIEVKCPWRVNLLLEIIDVVTNLQLDSHSIQSSNNDGVLSLTIKVKVGEFGNNLSMGMITQTLQRVIGNC